MRARILSLRLLLYATLFLASTGAALAQITNVTADQQTPTQGVGHDYIRLLSETVDPSTGALSLRITVPTPKGRGLTVPFAFAYDSNGIGTPYSFGGAPNGYILWRPNKGLLTQGGWSYSLPMLSFGDEATNDKFGDTCFWTHDYVFQDPSGGRHAMQLGTASDLIQGTACGFAKKTNVLSGGDNFFAGTPTGVAGLVVGRDGTRYDFSVTALSGSEAPTPGSNIVEYVPTAIEDRNGNKIVISPVGTTSGFEITDTLGRQALSASGFGNTGDTVSVSGLANPFRITWSTVAVNYTVGALIDTSTPYCGAGFPPNNTTQSVIRSITLPNGEQYSFTYDSDDPSIAHPFGFLTKITYPTGASVKYVWGFNPISTYAQFGGTDPNSGIPFSCDNGYDTPAVVTRTVSFDGINPALIQNFSYSTQPISPNSWSSKHTIVTTSDKTARGGTFETDYSYLALGIPNSPNDLGPDPLVPVENVITYKDFNGSILQTVTKVWQNQYLLTDETTQIGSGTAAPTSSVHNVYLSAAQGFQLQEKDEYDFGAGAKGALLRKTVTNYASFANTPIFPSAPSIFSLPCQVITYDGSGTNRVAESDFFYDGTSTTLCASSTAQTLPGTGTYTSHDETSYGTSASVPRGNLTKTINLCLQAAPACSSGNPATAYTYDETGQITSATDANGHPTQYSHADNYSVGTAPGNTNAFLTQIVRPTTNSVAHIEKFAYGYVDGQLRSSTDENNQVTSYQYNDPFARPTQANFPDGGETTISYNDAPPSPSVTTSRLMNTSNQFVTSTTTRDGIGHVVKTLLTTDPDCASGDRSDTTYDGLGRVFTVSNPYCTTSDSTNGLTTYVNDALGRPTTVTAPDGSTTTTSYSGSCGTVTDPTGKSRKSCSDGLGRLTQVTEDPSGLGYVTTYTYNALGDLIGAVQNGSRQRTFTYDSLSRLLTAANPESNTITYTYDANGNLTTKKDARNITATYVYDALNRLTQKSFSDGTPAALFTYDVSNPFNETVTNPVGRLVGEWTGINGQWASWKAFGYDQMGRLAQQWDCLPLAPSCHVFGTTTVYDLAGNPSYLTYPDGRLVHYMYSSANRPNQVTFNSFNGTAVYGGAYNYLSAATYAASGAPASLVLGNGLTEATAYNSRLQPCTQVISSSVLTALSRTYNFYPTASGNCHAGQGGNNGNVVSIADILQSNRTQSFTYDSLNRISTAQTAVTSGSDCWALSFGYDAWANLLAATPTRTGCPMTALNVGVNANNQITNSGFSYDASGDTLADGTNTYVYDAEARIASVNSGADVYTYDASGQRVQKQVGGAITQYSYLNGEVLAEYNTTTGDWSDYIYAGGRRLARADGYEHTLEITGTNCSNCGAQSYTFNMANAGGLAGYTIQAGDLLMWQQSQVTGDSGGIKLAFTNGTPDSTGVADQNGVAMDQADTNNNNGGFAYRRVDLTSEAGRTVSNLQLNVNSTTPAGNWQFFYFDMALVSKDGTVHPIYTGESGVSLSGSGTSGVTNVSNQVSYYGSGPSTGSFPAAIFPGSTTNYYHGDHLGSARLMTSFNGYPVWSATFLPFGQEWNPQLTTNHYKFTGKERDSESGLDNFGARYDSSTTGRFMSPDPLYVEEQKMLDPQQLNLYSYVRNNPLNLTDSTGMLIDVSCQQVNAQQCSQTVTDFNNRDGAQFSVTRDDKTGQLNVSGEVDPTKLSSGERALYDSITNKDATGTLTVVGNDSSFDFEKSTGKGANSLDRSDLNALNGADNRLSGEVISHAALESYDSAKPGVSLDQAHDFASRFFPELQYNPRNWTPFRDSAGLVAGASNRFYFSRLDIMVRARTTFKTPIPYVDWSKSKSLPPRDVTNATITPSVQ
jgi:RHS repeat-associated protein